MGKYKKGQRKPPGSGRKKTSKHTSLKEGLEKEKFDLTTEFLNLYKKSYDTKEKLNILKALARYTEIVPKAGVLDLPESPPPEPSKPAEKAPSTEEPNAVLQLLEDSLNDPPKH